MRSSFYITPLIAVAFATSAFAQSTPLEVRAPWARPSLSGVANGAAYLTIHNHADAADRLTGARAAIAERTEIHEMAMEGSIMRMRRIEAVAVPAHGTAELKPGGLHVMLLGLKEPLRPGQRFPLTLSFANAGEVAVEVEVSVNPPGAAAPAEGRGHGHGGHR